MSVCYSKIVQLNAVLTDTVYFEFDQLVTSAIKGGGPTLIAARIDAKPAVGATDRDPVQIRERFMRGLGVKRGTG